MIYIYIYINICRQPISRPLLAKHTNCALSEDPMRREAIVTVPKTLVFVDPEPALFSPPPCFVGVA